MCCLIVVYCVIVFFLYSILHFEQVYKMINEPLTQAIDQFNRNTLVKIRNTFVLILLLYFMYFLLTSSPRTICKFHSVQDFFPLKNIHLHGHGILDEKTFSAGDNQMSLNIPLSQCTR